MMKNGNYWWSANVHMILDYVYFGSTNGKLLPSATKLRQGNVITPACHSVHRGGIYLSAWDAPLANTPPPSRHPRDPGRHTPRADTPPPADGNCSGRYASYWNAFLFGLQSMRIWLHLYYNTLNVHTDLLFLQNEIDILRSILWRNSLLCAL